MKKQEKITKSNLSHEMPLNKPRTKKYVKKLSKLSLLEVPDEL